MILVHGSIVPVNPNLTAYLNPFTANTVYVRSTDIAVLCGDRIYTRYTHNFQIPRTQSMNIAPHYSIYHSKAKTVNNRGRHSTLKYLKSLRSYTAETQ